MMKRFQTIALDVLLLGEKETSENKDQKTQKQDHGGFDLHFNAGKKKTFISIFKELLVI